MTSQAPRTHGSLLLLDLRIDMQWNNGNPIDQEWLARMLAGIEAEAAALPAAPAGLDVARLARALADEFDGWAKGSERYVAERVAAAYSEGESATQRY